MSKKYTVKSGDTLRKIATNFYGDERLWPKIWKANSFVKNPDIIRSGWVLTIPDIPSRKPAGQTAQPFPEFVSVSPDNIDSEGNSYDVAILIDGETFSLWPSVNIAFSFDTIADTFSLTGPFDPFDPKQRKIFQPFIYKEVALYVGGKKVLTGLGVTTSLSSDGESKTVTLEGYSVPGILSDCPQPPNAWPITINGLNLKEIAEKLADPFGIKVIFNGDPGAKFSKSDKVDVEVDQSTYDFLTTLSKQRGFVISSDRFGNMVFQKTTTEVAGVSLIDGKYPVLSSSSRYDGQRRYSDITAISTEKKKGRGQSYTMFDNELKTNGINRPLVFQAQDINAGNLKDAAIAKWGRTISDSINIDVTVESWFRSDAKLWKDNQKVVYKSDYLMIYNETDFLIRNVTLKKDPEGQTAELSLVFPESYNGELRDSFPWQSI